MKSIRIKLMVAALLLLLTPIVGFAQTEDEFAGYDTSGDLHGNYIHEDEQFGGHISNNKQHERLSGGTHSSDENESESVYIPEFE